MKMRTKNPVESMKTTRITPTSATIKLMLVASLLVVSSLSVAQNYRAQPTYGYLNIEADFEGDPIEIEVTAGGDVSVEADLNLPRACEGYINAGAPDLSINYVAGNLPLQIYVHSDADTTLIINDPLGQWQCDDDSIGTNPAKRFASPPSGQYDVWIGTFDRSRARARVYVTEK